MTGPPPPTPGPTGWACAMWGEENCDGEGGKGGEGGEGGEGEDVVYSMY